MYGVKLTRNIQRNEHTSYSYYYPSGFDRHFFENESRYANILYQLYCSKYQRKQFGLFAVAYYKNLKLYMFIYDIYKIELLKFKISLSY